MLHKSKRPLVVHAKSLIPSLPDDDLPTHLELHLVDWEGAETPIHTMLDLAPLEELRTLSSFRASGFKLVGRVEMAPTPSQPCHLLIYFLWASKPDIDISGLFVRLSRREHI
jgi:hypothetical protein